MVDSKDGKRRCHRTLVVSSFDLQQLANSLTSMVEYIVYASVTYDSPVSPGKSHRSCTIGNEKST